MGKKQRMLEEILDRVAGLEDQMELLLRDNRTLSQLVGRIRDSMGDLAESHRDHWNRRYEEELTKAANAKVDAAWGKHVYRTEESEINEPPSDPSQ